MNDWAPLRTYLNLYSSQAAAGHIPTMRDGHSARRASSRSCFAAGGAKVHCVVVQMCNARRGCSWLAGWGCLSPARQLLQHRMVWIRALSSPATAFAFARLRQRIVWQAASQDPAWVPPSGRLCTACVMRAVLRLCEGMGVGSQPASQPASKAQRGTAQQHQTAAGQNHCCANSLVGAACPLSPSPQNAPDRAEGG